MLTWTKILSKVSKENKLNLLEDFSARFGLNHNLWRDRIGKEGVGNTNPNSVLLLQSSLNTSGTSLTILLFELKTTTKYLMPEQ